MATILVPTCALDRTTLRRIIHTIEEVEEILRLEDLEEGHIRVTDPVTKLCLALCKQELSHYKKPSNRKPKGTAFKSYQRNGKTITPYRQY